VTQQNSALVEENAATAKTLEQQANVMSDRVGAFKFDAAESEAPAALAAAPVAPKAGPTPDGSAPPRLRSNGSSRSPARRTQTNLAVALQADQDWKEF